MTKKLFIILIFCISFTRIAFGDDIPKYFELKKGSELFPDNAYSIVSDDALNISKLNGSVLFSLPISQYSTNGYPLKVTLNYSGGISTTSYAYCNIQEGNWAKMHQNRPAWILGVNGIAVQVFAGNAMFTCDPHYQLTSWIDNANNGNLTLGNKDLTWTIDGYDVCNELYPFGNGQNAHQDVIKILKEDGSILEFRNQFKCDVDAMINWTEPKYYTGKYYINEVNSKGYAIVEFDSSQKNLYTQFLKQAMYMGNPLDSVEQLYYQPRILKYYPGDGYEYIFKEYKMPYGSASYGYRDKSGLLDNHHIDPIKSFGFCESSMGNNHLDYGPVSHPNIFYLFQINSSVKEITKFYYAKHISDKTQSFIDESIARAALTSFNNHGISYGSDYVRLEAFNKKFDITIGSAVFDGYYVNHPPAASAKLLMYSNLSPIYASYFLDFNLTDYSLYYSSLGYVTKIISDDMKYTFQYEDYTKTYTDYKFPITAATSYFKIQLLNKRLKSYENYSKKVDLYYIPSNYNTANPFHSPVNTLDYNAQTFNYLNNVIDSAVYYTKTNSVYNREKKETYNYALTVGGGLVNLTKKDTLISTIVTEDYKTNKTSVTESHFNSYQIDPILYFNNSLSQPPFVSHTNLSYSKTYNSSDIFENTVYYNNYESNPYIILEDSSWSAVKGKSGSQIFKNKTKNSYYFGSSLPDKIVYDNSELNNKMGFLLKSDTIRIYHGNDTLFTKTVNNYRNFLRDSLSGIITEKNHNKFKADDKYDSLVAARSPILEGRSYESLFCEIAVYDLDTIGINQVFSQPIYGILENTKSYNRFDEQITGKSNNLINNIIYEGKPLFAIGKPKSDTLYGNYGVSKFNNSYDYSFALSDGASNFSSSNSVGLPIKSTNKLGAQTRMFYGYDEYSYDETVNFPECSFPYTEANILYNRNYSKPGSLNSEYGADLNSVPIINALKVRKFKFDNYHNLVIDTVKLNELKAKNRLGNIIQSVDFNGWLSEFKYDLNGRMKMAWLPGDFPDPDSLLDRYDSLYCPQNSGKYNPDTEGQLGIYEMRRYGCTRDRYHTIRTFNFPLVSEVYFEHGYQHFTFWFSSASISNFRIDYQPEYCDCQPYYEGGIIHNQYEDIIKGKNISNAKLDDSPNLQTTVGYDSCYTYKDFLMVDSTAANINFYKPTEAYLVYSLDSAVIKIYIASLIHFTGEIEPMQMHLTSNLLDCINFYYELNPTISQDVENGNYYLTIKIDNPDCLAELVNKMNSENDNLSLHAEMLTENQGLRFGEITMKSYGTFLMNQRKDTDYTLRNDYSFEYNYIFRQQKIDDNLHSNNNFPLQFNDFGYRRLASNIFFRNNKISSNTRLSDNSTTTYNYDAFGNPLSKGVPYFATPGGETTVYDSFDYDLAGNVIKTTNKDYSHKTDSVVYGIPMPDFGLTENQFNYFCKRVRSIDEIGQITDMYYDGFDNLLEKVEDVTINFLDPKLNIITRYRYDKFNRLKFVIDMKKDTTKYWYDEFGNIKYKYHPDMGYTSYRYDDLGNLRFSQDQNQADSARMSFFEYDDLNRLMVSGEIKFVSNIYNSTSIEPVPNSVHENYTFSRLTDILNPNIINNWQYDVLSLNSTLWIESTLNPDYCDKKLELSEILLRNAYPLNYWTINHVLGDTTRVPLPMIYHVNNINDDQINPWHESYLTGFEDFNSRPQNVLNAYYYDDFPLKSGPVWRYIQNKNIWDSLAPKGKLRNTKGKVSAMAYRENGNQAFNYSVFSYDERGRVEAVLKFTENLGFDGVYYEYNSANLVINTRVIDPIRQFNTWYGYDNSGRVDTVWSKVADGGLNYDHTLWNNLQPSLPDLHTKPLVMDFNYTYTKTDQIAKVFYPNSLSETFTYYPRGWSSNHIFKNGATEHLNTMLAYLDNGLISSSNEILQLSPPTLKTTLNIYAYDNRNQLTNWDIQGIMPPAPVKTEHYTYDDVGNRTYRTKSESMKNTDYKYNDSKSPNRLMEYVTRNNVNVIKEDIFQSFYSDGALRQKIGFRDTGIVIGTPYTVCKENFYYNYLNLTNKYISQYGPAFNFGIDTNFLFNYPAKTEWRYRFNPFGEREQKRMYLSPTGDNWNDMYPWVYYLLGIDNRQYATYYGAQTEANSIYYSDFMIGVKPEPWRPVTYFYPVEYNVYGNEQAPKVTYRYVNGQWQKQYKIYDYLGSERFTVLGTGQIINYKQYSAYGETMLDTLGKARQGYIGKEKDVESQLGDHGVRKYDPETGRFNSPDPLFEKYFGWSPYQYSMNNPIWAKDYDGRDIIVLLDKEGAPTGLGVNAGHMAVLIGNDKDGWQLYSKNGAQNGGPLGDSKFQAGEKENTFKTLNDFLEDKDEKKYDVGFQIKTTTEEDKIMKKAAVKQVKRDYDLCDDSCADTASESLKSIGKASGTGTVVNYNKYGGKSITNKKNQIPKGRYSDIKKGNKGKELDLNKMRKKKD